MNQCVLLPIDLRHESSWSHAFPEAIDCARRRRCKLVVMTVFRDMNAMLEGLFVSFQLEKAMSEAQRQLNELVAVQSCADIPVVTEVRFGSVGAEILAAAAAHQAGVIVMQSHRPEMLDRLIGPNAAYVALHAPCSVFVLRQPGYKR